MRKPTDSRKLFARDSRYRERAIEYLSNRKLTEAEIRKAETERERRLHIEKDLDEYGKKILN